MSKNWDYSNLTSEAKNLGGPDLFKQYLYEEGKRDGSVVGMIIGALGLVTGLAIAAYEEGPKAVAWVKQKMSDRRPDEGVGVPATDVHDDCSLAPDTSAVTPKAVIAPEIFGIGRPLKMSDEERYKRCQDVFNTVSYVTGIGAEDIQSRKRNPELVRARQLVMYFCREYSDMSLEEIGKVLGKHDHTTVMSGISHVKSELQWNYELKRVVDAIESLLAEQEEKEVDSNEET